jgi:hypothetical protein
MPVQREPVSIRFPSDLLAEARETKDQKESLNDFVVSAVGREVRRRRALRALDRIVEIRERVAQRTGLHPDPVPLVRRLREGTERRD